MGEIFECIRYSSSGLEASRIVKSSKGKLLGLSGYNGNVGTRYIQVFDSASLPADGVVPALVFTLLAGAVLPLQVIGLAIPFQLGIVVCNSSTPNTKTIGAADSLFQFFYA